MLQQKPIGPSFVSELEAAGVADRPFGWSVTGDLCFMPDMDPKDIAAVEAVYAAHDPTKPAPAAA